MNKADLIDRLSTQLGSRRDATLAVETLVDVVIREVAAGGSVGITGFGTFERADRAPRTGRNPRTGERVPIAGTSSPRFRPGTYFKAAVSEPSVLPAAGLAGGRAPAAGATPAAATPRKRTARKSATTKAAPARKTATTKAAPARRAATTKAAPARTTAATKAAPTKAAARKSTAGMMSPENVAAVDTALRDSAKKTLKKSAKADKPKGKGKDKAAKGKDAKDKTKKKTKKK